MVRLWFLILSLFLLCSCGFHLRKPQPLPPSLQTIYLDTADPYSDSSIQLRQLLQALRIHLVENSHMAPITLWVFGESFSSVSVTKSASAKTKQYRLQLTLQYQLQDEKGLIIYGPQRIDTHRLYTVQEDQILSSGNATDALHKEMQQDTIYQLVR